MERVSADRPAAERRYVVREILYATDQKRGSRASPVRFYRNEWDFGEKLSLGTCHVSIPAEHKLGELESPSILRLEFRPNPNKHVVLLGVRPRKAETFYRRLRDRVDKSANSEAFVFIHGYNVSFPNAARRAAQLAHDLNFDGAPILYSWASKAAAAAYPEDEETVRLSVAKLKHFLTEVALTSGARRVHLIAHSMGARALTEALEALARELEATEHSSTLFRQVVLAAPDINADLFRQLAAAIVSNAERVTLYACASDKALAASKTFHGYRRAGECIVIVPGVDTIDASAVDTSFLAHSAFASNRAVLTDLGYLLNEGVAPERRVGLIKRKMDEGTYYAFLA